MAHLHALPYPAAGDIEHGVGHSTQVIRDLFHGEATLYIACQGTKNFSMVGAPQYIEQVLFVIFTGRCQCIQTQAELFVKYHCIKTFCQQSICR